MFRSPTFIPRQVAPPVDQKELHQTAQELNFEFQQLRDEEYSRSRRTGKPKLRHKIIDGFFDWRHQRRLNKKQSTKLMGRKWVPYVLLSGLALIWTPDQYKISFLYWLDGVHESVKLNIHLWYWRQVMPKEQYALLMEQMEQNMPKGKRIQSPDCPM
jgi:hypothetical protein